jgi:uncharacterized protein (TIGR02001 family)
MTSSRPILTLAAAAFGTFASLAGAAFADDTINWGTLSAYVAVTTDYRYRGISQNDRNLSEQGSINWSGPLGFYAGTWVAKTNWTGGAYCPTCDANPTFEMDLYAGKHFDLDGTDLNIEAYYYSYPDANKNMLGTYASYYETIVQLSHTFDKLTLTLTGANSPEWSLHGGTGWYLEGSASYALTDWLSASANVGHQWVQRAPRDYTHWDVGFTATYKGFSLDARYVGNDISTAECGFWMTSGPKACDHGFVATITYNIADLFG